MHAVGCWSTGYGRSRRRWSRSTPDPLLQPKGKGVVIVPRPGVVAEVLLALAPTGEVDGTLLGVDGEPREGMALELIDGGGAVMARTISEYDGFFLFDLVPYGRYRLRVAPGVAQALGVRAELGTSAVLDRVQPSIKLGPVRLAGSSRPAQVASGP
jgi:hypothetical protein